MCMCIGVQPIEVGEAHRVKHSFFVEISRPGIGPEMLGDWRPAKAGRLMHHRNGVFCGGEEEAGAGRQQHRRELAINVGIV